MGYLKIPNLYKDQTILLFKDVFSLEKIHGSSSHISFKDNNLNFFAGGAKHEEFIELFNQEVLLQRFKAVGCNVVVYGEAYGGKMQGMSATYGKELKFVAFDVKLYDRWLCVPDAKDFVSKLGLDFVPYVRIPADIIEIDKQRDAASEQAKKCGILEPKKSEGVVLRPIIELTKNNGERIICKHKREDFSEVKTPRIVDTVKLEVMIKVNDIVEEWVTENRLQNILSHIPQPHTIEMIKDVIKIMINDVTVEAKDEIETSKELIKYIGAKTAKLYKTYLNSSLYG